MPKASRTKRQPPASSTRPQSVTAEPSPADPSSVPAWVRSDWSETSFPIPRFRGKSAAKQQLAWAAKNATVAIHDAFAAGSWDGIADKEYAVYLAVCDVVLQRYVVCLVALTASKDRARLATTGRLPMYAEWKDAREADIGELICLVSKL